MSNTHAALLSKPAQHADNLERMAWLKSIVIEFNRTEELTKELRLLHRYGSLARKTGTNADCLVLTGPSGSGKTTLLTRYANSFPVDTSGLSDVRRLLYVEVPTKCTIKSTAQAILVALGDLNPGAGNLVQMTKRIVDLVREQRVEMIILDEFQHIIDKRSAHVAYEVANWIKQLVNKTYCPFVLAGLPEVTSVVDSNEQLRRRCYGKVSIKAFDWEDEHERMEFRVLLKKFDENLPFDVLSGLSDHSMALRIHAYSEGLLGRVSQLLKVAGMLAIEDDLPCLDMAGLARAAERFRPDNVAEWVNPFDVETVVPFRPVAAPEPETRTTRIRAGKRKETLPKM